MGDLALPAHSRRTGAWDPLDVAQRRDATCNSRVRLTPDQRCTGVARRSDNAWEIVVVTDGVAGHQRYPIPHDQKGYWDDAAASYRLDAVEAQAETERRRRRDAKLVAHNRAVDQERMLTDHAVRWQAEEYGTRKKTWDDIDRRAEKLRADICGGTPKPADPLLTAEQRGDDPNRIYAGLKGLDRFIRETHARIEAERQLNLELGQLIKETTP